MYNIQNMIKQTWEEIKVVSGGTRQGEHKILGAKQEVL